MEYDFVEIGTSDFETLIEQNNSQKGISIEPIQYYLDKLPNNPNVIKSNYAISDIEGEIKIFWITPEDIKKYNLPWWVRGCNSVNEPHFQHKVLLGNKWKDIVKVDIVKCLTWKSLVKLYNIDSIKHLKIDTEGHDLLILEEYYKLCQKNPRLLADTIIFENNGLTDPIKFKYVESLFEKIGYKSYNREGDNHQFTKIKIALLGPPEWALANINFFLKKYLSSCFEVEIFDWSNASQIQQAIGGEYQIVIGEVIILSLGGIGYSVGKDVIFIPMFHHDVINQSTTRFGKQDWDPNLLKQYYVGAISQDIVSKLKNKYDINSKLLPIGVEGKFWKKRSITQINKLGIVGDLSNRDKGWDEIKRPDLFWEVVNKLNLSGDFIFGKSFKEGTKIYDGFDMVICTSKGEGNPMAFLECAAAKIPFISTKVGIVPEYSSVKTFDTVEEAVEIIRYLNSSPLILQQYVNDVYNEVMADREWSKIIKKYWIPTINNILQNENV